MAGAFSLSELTIDPPYVHPPPQGRRFPPTPKGGTDTTQQSPEFWYIQRKFFFGAFSACDFLLISYCSWAK